MPKLKIIKPLLAIYPCALSWIFAVVAVVFVFLGITRTHATEYTILPGDDLVGKMYTIRAHSGDTFTKIGMKYDVGYYELAEANPGINPDDVSSGTSIVIPSRFVLPPQPREGIIINLSELRLYYFPPGGNTVVTEPVGIGRIGWKTPTGVMNIIEKRKDPVWHVPPAVREFRAQQGMILPKSMPAGPDNPLGQYAMRLSQPSYLIHGTNDVTGVGRRSSAGCIRMYPQDVENLFSQVEVGTPVRIVDLPYKAGWDNGKLYLEAHVPLQEQRHVYGRDLQAMEASVREAVGSKPSNINWAVAEIVAQEMNGVPQIIGTQ